ncbi:hypothetical protein EC9_22680 [Rosistilla ulvae]|uniref:Uncharacterized protein n=1 Tax=Rosistilla ulvae TaxID=1930277 RepID=A0A517LZN4_9BACT|nr:hypothetical protein [Rosistilla ulvae]QDS88082.1 hypothetical protein EC9_22680 [Rosistilla ulvae]
MFRRHLFTKLVKGGEPRPEATFKETSLFTDIRQVNRTINFEAIMVPRALPVLCPEVPKR